MMKQKHQLVGVLILALALIPTPVYPCSIFSLQEGHTVFLAGNEDWYHSQGSLKIVPATSMDFGYAIFGVSAYIDSYPQIGMNEKGLGVDWATVPSSTFIYDSQRPNLHTSLLPELMKTCESVQDVVDFIRQYNIPHFAEEHLIEPAPQA